MADPTELALGATAADALSGTASANAQFIYCTIADSTYYTEWYELMAIADRALALPNSLRVVKDAALTYGVMSGQFVHDGATVNYAGSTGNALTDDDTNYIYLTAAGTLTKNTTGFPSAAHVPLAEILTASGAYAHTAITDRRYRAVFKTVGQTELQSHRIPLQLCRNNDGTVMDATGGAGLFAIANGGFGTGGITLDGEAASGNVKTDDLNFEFTLPDNYIASGTVQLAITCRESVGAATVSTTLTADVRESDGDGTASLDLGGAFDESDVVDSWQTRTKTITDADLLPGDILQVYVKITTNDTGGGVGTVAQIGDIDIKCDVEI